MANIKFFRTAANYWETNTPMEGYIWFNTDDTTINLYKNSAWEAYSGIKSASYTNNILTITPCKGDAISVDLSILTSASDLVGLIQRVATLESNYSTLDGKVTTVEGKVSTIEGTVGTHTQAIATVIGKLDGIESTVVAAIEAEAAVRLEEDGKLSERINGLSTTVTNNGTTLTNHVADTTVHITAQERTNWNQAKSDIDAFLAATEDADGVIETIKEINNYVNEHTDAFTTLSGKVDTNTTNISTNTADITDLKTAVETINTTIEENELIVASALTDLNTRVTALTEGTVKSVEGQNYVEATTTDGAVVVKATTGAVANGADGLALASDVKTYVDTCIASSWEWVSF